METSQITKKNKTIFKKIGNDYVAMLDLRKIAQISSSVTKTFYGSEKKEFSVQFFVKGNFLAQGTFDKLKDAKSFILNNVDDFDDEQRIFTKEVVGENGVVHRFYFVINSDFRTTTENTLIGNKTYVSSSLLVLADGFYRTWSIAREMESEKYYVYAEWGRGFFPIFCNGIASTGVAVNFLSDDLNSFVRDAERQN